MVITYMSRAEFKQILGRLFPDGERITQAAEMLHRDIRTVRRWHNGPSGISPEAAALLRVMVKHGIEPEEIYELTEHKG